MGTILAVLFYLVLVGCLIAGLISMGPISIVILLLIGIYYKLKELE